MIDIHSHILPMIDDGANSVEMALEMLKMAYEDDTDAIILTPHFARVYGFNNPNEKIKELYEDLKHIVKYERIPIELYLGCEYLYSSKETFHEEVDEITSLNKTKYVLMEFFFDVDGNTILEATEELIKYGFIPILAHPERYDSIQEDINIILKAKKLGALLQMNKGSILGRYGQLVKETCIELLNEYAYTFVGSDAHHPKMRTPMMYDAYQIIKENFGRNYAKDLFEVNAKELLKIGGREDEEY